MNKSIANTFSPENERKEFSKRLVIALENYGLRSAFHCTKTIAIRNVFKLKTIGGKANDLRHDS